MEVGEESLNKTTYIREEGLAINYEKIERTPISTLADELEGEIIDATMEDNTIEVSNFEGEAQETAPIERKTDFAGKVDTIKEIVDNTKDELISGYKSDISAQNQLAKGASSKANTLNVKIKEKEDRINVLKKNLKEIDDYIAKIGDQHIQNLHSINTTYDNKINSDIKNYAILRAQNIANRKSLHDIYNSKIKHLVLAKTAGLNIIDIEKSFEDIITDSEKLMGSAIEYAEMAVNKAKEDIYALDDDLYFPHSNQTVVDRHKALMIELQTMTAPNMGAFSSSIASYISNTNIALLVTSAFSKAMLEHACISNGCYTADTRYFVGYYGKSGDFKAPYAPPAIYLPNVREMVHLDRIDYDNIAKDSKGHTSKDSFMNYGPETPEIWNMILDEKIFVERPLDLKKLLSLGGEATLFMSGGRYPCNIGGIVVNIDAYKSRFILSARQDGDANNPTCTDIGLSSGKIIDIESGLEAVAVRSTASNIQDILLLEFNAKSKTLEGSTSELGIFLNTNSQGSLVINSIPRIAFHRLQEVEDNQSKDSKFEPKIEDELYRKALFDHNQIGNFLYFVETEQAYRQTKDEVEVAINDLRNELVTRLESMGLEVSPNINLANQSEYDALLNQLERIKNKNVSEGTGLIKNVVVENNEIVEDRLNRLKNVYIALQKDKNELISLSDATDSGSALDEAIKSEEANQKVLGEYGSEAEQAFKDSLERFPRPYCATY